MITTILFCLIGLAVGFYCGIRAGGKVCGNWVGKAISDASGGDVKKARAMSEQLGIKL